MNNQKKEKKQVARLPINSQENTSLMPIPIDKIMGYPRSINPINQEHKYPEFNTYLDSNKPKNNKSPLDRYNR
jgi:hypothetical protein